jgi:hypothetical protein
MAKKPAKDQGVWDYDAESGDLVPAPQFQLPPPDDDDMKQEANGNGNGNGNSAWAGIPVWARVAFLLGVPSLIALGTVYNSEVNLKATAAANTAQLSQVLQNQSSHNAATMEKLAENIAIGKETNRLLRMICVSQQSTEQGRAACQGKE